MQADSRRNLARCSLQEEATEDSPATSPRAPRIAANNQAVLITTEGDNIPVIIKDVSVSGFRLVASETLYAGENIFVGEEVRIQPARGKPFRAKIVWALGCEAGGIFLEPPPPL